MREFGAINWYVQRNGREYGPLTLPELRLFLSAGHSSPDDRFSYQYQAIPQHSGYLVASEIEEFQRKLEADVQPPEHFSASSGDHSTRSYVGSATIVFQAFFDQIASLLLKSWVLTIDPRRFGRRWIEPSGNSPVRGALSFFTTCFSIAFIILTLTSKFSYYTGESEIRVLMKISLQLLIGIIVLYAAVKLFRSNIKLSSMTSLILYFDGIYLIFSAIAYSCIRIIQYSGHLEKDLYANMFESCVAERSLTYWILRGDLEFFINSTNQTTQSAISEYIHLIIAVACICLIGRVFRTYYKPHVAVFLTCASATFVIVSEGYAYGEEKLTDYLVACTG